MYETTKQTIDLKYRYTLRSIRDYPPQGCDCEVLMYPMMLKIEQGFNNPNMYKWPAQTTVQDLIDKFPEFLQELSMGQNYIKEVLVSLHHFTTTTRPCASLIALKENGSILSVYEIESTLRGDELTMADFHTLIAEWNNEWEASRLDTPDELFYEFTGFFINASNEELSNYVNIINFFLFQKSVYDYMNLSAKLQEGPIIDPKLDIWFRHVTDKCPISGHD